MITSTLMGAAPRFNQLLHCAVAVGDRVRLVVCGVADSEPWRHVEVAVTDQCVLWLDGDAAVGVKVGRDAITRVSFERFDAPPNPVYFEADIDRNAGNVALVHPMSIDRPVEGATRAALIHQWIDAVRLSDVDAHRLRQALQSINPSRCPLATARSEVYISGRDCTSSSPDTVTRPPIASIVISFGGAITQPFR